MVRRLLIGLALACILLLYFSISLGFAVAMKTQYDSIGYSAYCPKQYLYAKEENVQTEEERQFIRNCFCERMDILQLAYGWQDRYRSRCPEYVASIIYYYLSMPVFGLAVQMVNLAMSKTVVYAARWFKFRDVTSEGIFQMTFLYFLLVFNMLLPQVMVNLNFSDKTIIKTV